MSQKSYSRELEVSTTQQSIYKSITIEIDKWWTIHSNPIYKSGDQLTVKFGETTHKTMTVTKAEPNQSVYWEVKDAYMDVSALTKKDEWVGTVIRWELSEIKEGCKISFTHEGLTPSFECFTICQNGWNYFLDSLKAYLETGKGTPHTSN